MSEIDWRGFLKRNAPHASSPVPSWAAVNTQMLGEILESLEKIMSDQDTLNQYVADLSAAVATVDAEIKALQAQPAAAPLDWTAANSALTSLQGLEPPAPATAAAPVTDPTAAPTVQQ